MTILDPDRESDLAHAISRALALEDRLRIAASLVDEHVVLRRLVPLIHEAADLVEQLRWDLEGRP